jgi:PAS domain S-box-containing protein
MRSLLPRNLHLQAKLFLFAAAILVVLAAVASVNMVVEGERLLAYTADKEFEQFQRVFASEREVRESDLGLAIELLLDDQPIREAIAGGDRRTLLRLFRPLFETSLHPRYNIDQFHFIDPRSRSLLRVHRPDLFGDDLRGHRKLIVRANEEQRPERGIEIGAGGVGLRVAYPVFLDGRHVGCVELGTSLSTLLEAARRATDMEFAVALSDSALAKVPLYKADLPRLSASGLRLTAISDPDLSDTVSNMAESESDQRYHAGDRWFVTTSVPLRDYSGEEIGKIFLFRDFTLLHEEVYASVYRKIFLVMLLAAGMAVVIYFVLETSFVQPFLDVLGVSERISRGETDVEINGKAGGEVGLLMGNLHRMASNIEHLETERRHSEDIQLKLGNAMAQVSEGVVMTDLTGSITYVNPAFEKITGYSAEEAIGQNPRFLKSGVQSDAYYQSMWEILASGRAWCGEFVNRRKDGTLYHEQSFISPLREPDGRLSGYMAIKSEVTEIKKLEAQLRQAQKMEALGTLAGGIAHDFNNILTAILGYAQLLEMDLPEDAREQEAVHEILRATDRARGLVHQILTFARKGDQRKIPMRIAPAAEETLKMLSATLPASIRIERDIRSDAVVSINPNWIHQIVMNLGTNAVHAMEGEGILTLRCYNEMRDPAEGGKEKAPTGMVVLEVEDTGHGIPPNLQERIFEPFFTTKPSGKGTGLGLSVVDGIVRECGGSIVVMSERGRGTTFRVRLPIVAPTEKRAPPQAPAEPPGGRGHILFVDDERPLVELAKVMLPKFGYRVSVAADAQQALELFRADPERYDILVTDLDMPGMTGDALIGEIHAIRPSLPAILCTGQGKRSLDETLGGRRVDATLLKPLTMADVATAVTRVLTRLKSGRDVAAAPHG